MTIWRLGGRLSAIVGVLWLGAATPALAQPFAPPVSYATGGYSQGIALADVNHDSKLDLIVSTCDYNAVDDVCENYHVRVRLGLGDGTFGTEADFPISEAIYTTNMPTPYGIAVADFNGDTHPDIATANQNSDDISILYGDGTGSFTPAPASIATGAGPQGIVAADFNNDNFVDLAVTNTLDETVSVFLNDGTGVFTEATGSPFPASFYPSTLRAAHFNGDANLDLVITNTADSSLTVMLGVGDGSFIPQDPIVLDFCGCPTPVDVAVLDFNGDGVNDLVVADVDEFKLWLLVGNGDGTFAEPTSLDTSPGPASLAVGDFNRDGIEDVAVADYWVDTVEVFSGNGTDFTSPTAWFTTSTAAEPSGPLWLSAGDLDGDGWFDLAVGQDLSEDTAVLLNTACCMVSVSTAGTGSGSVTSVPSGIDCGDTCAHVFDPADAVELTATPTPGSMFTGWSGACTGTGTCSLPAGVDATVTATFDLLALNAGFPGGTVGAAYLQLATTSNGGTAPFHFTLQSGSLPPGVILIENDDDIPGFAAGTLLGVPIHAGTFNFSLGVSDSQVPDAAAGSGSFSITIAAAATTTFAADSSAPYSPVPQLVGLVAAVSAAGDVNGGTVTFTVRDSLNNVIGIPAVSGPVVDGIAVADYTLPAATAGQTLTITAVYGTSADYIGSSATASLVVEPAATATAGANATAPYSVTTQSVALSATVTSASGTVNAGTVTFTLRDGLSNVIGAPTVSGAITAGTATALYSLPGGTTPQTLTIFAHYDGSTNFAFSVDSTHLLTIVAASTTTTGANASATYNATLPQSVPLSATVASAGGSINEGTVTFTVRDASSAVIGSPVTSGTVTSGAASATYVLPAGVNGQVLTITAVYGGSTNFDASTDATHTLTVGAAASTTAGANATATFSTSAQSVPLSAMVTSANGIVGAGTVTFTVRTAGNVVVGSPVTSAPVAGGTAFASYTLPGGTSVQTLTITAVYNGSSNFATSTDATHTLTIGAASTTTTPANASVATGAAPQSVPLSAVVASTGGTVGTGTVTFSVRTAGNVVVGSDVSGPVAGGVATATYTLPGGTPPQALTIVASYGATTNFGASTGSGTLDVNTCPASIVVGPSALPLVRLGQPFSVTFTADALTSPTFSLTGSLPPGLTQSGATVSGTPTALGRFDVSVTATASACTGSANFSFRVMRPPVFVTGIGGGSTNVRAFDNHVTMTANFLADPAFTGGVRVALADMNGDGVDDIITAPGPGASVAEVKVFDGASGTVIKQFAAYPGSSLGGLYVAAGDVNADGTPDIITGRDGADSEVRVFDGRTGAVLLDFFAYPFGVAGVRVAAGDIDADGAAEIITSPPFGFAPQVRVFDGNGALKTSFFAYHPAFIAGVYVAAGDIDGDGHADIVTGADAGGGPHVIAFSGADGHVLHSFFAYDPAFPNGVRVAVGDLDLDGHAEIITAAGPGGGPHVRVFDGVTGAEVAGLFAYDPAMPLGAFVAAPIAQPRMVVETPTAGSTQSGAFQVAGWAALPGSPTDSGVDTIHVWAVPVAGGAPVWVGVPQLGLSRPDVAALLGGDYAEAGFSLQVDTPPPPGVYDLWVFARSSVSGTFTTWRLVRVTIAP